MRILPSERPLGRSSAWCAGVDSRALRFMSRLGGADIRPMRSPRNLRRLWVILVLTACSAAVGAAPAAAIVLHGPKGIVPARTGRGHFGRAPRPGARPARALRALAPAQAHPTLEYHGGPVMRSTSVYTIFWQPSSLPIGVQSFPASPSYTESVNGYFAGVAADSGRASNVYSLATQYHGTAGEPIEYLTSFPGSAGSYGDTAIDAKPFPASGCTDLAQPGGVTLPVCLTEQQLAAEIESVVKANRWQTGLQDMVFIYTPQGVGGCFGAGPESEANQCSYTYYCAYHDGYGTLAKPTIFADMPYAATPTCDDRARPGGSTAGPALDATSHEHNEAITDPTGKGWWDSAGSEATNADYGFENGDLCVLEGYSETFGPLLEGSSAAGMPGAFNQIVGGSDYLLQMEWSDLAGRCAQRLPAVSFTPPGAAETGGAVSLSAVATTDSPASPISTYEWTFGDANTSVDGADTASTASAAHSFCAPGEYQVKLVVEDKQGDPASVTHAVSVTGPNRCSVGEPVKEPVKEPSPEPTPAPGSSLLQGSGESSGGGGSGQGPPPASGSSGGSALASPPSPSATSASTLPSTAQVAKLLGLPANGRRIEVSGRLALGHAQCPPACGVTLQLYAKVTSVSHKHRVTRLVPVGAARVQGAPKGAVYVRAPQGPNGVLSISLNAKGRALLRRGHVLACKLVVTVEGQEGGVWTISRSLWLTSTAGVARRALRR
jgi:PKD domain